MRLAPSLTDEDEADEEAVSLSWRLSGDSPRSESAESRGVRSRRLVGTGGKGASRVDRARLCCHLDVNKHRHTHISIQPAQAPYYSTKHWLTVTTTTVIVTYLLMMV